MFLCALCTILLSAIFQASLFCSLTTPTFPLLEHKSCQPASLAYYTVCEGNFNLYPLSAHSMCITPRNAYIMEVMVKVKFELQWQSDHMEAHNYHHLLLNERELPSTLMIIVVK